MSIVLGAGIKSTSNLALRELWGRIALGLFLLSVVVSFVLLTSLIVVVLINGVGGIDIQFLTSLGSLSRPEDAGIFSALIGTIYVTAIPAILTVPIGVATAVYIEEFAPDNFLTKFVNLNISNLAGVPSVVYGLLGLTIFVGFLVGNRGPWSGGLTLTLLVLPIVIITSQEAIKAVPSSYRDAGYALGATKWDIVKKIVLPQALSGILSGTILSLSRAIGEAAPIILISGVVLVTFLPRPPLLQEDFTTIPVQIFSWFRQPQTEFQDLAASGIVVLLALLLLFNSAAIIIRSMRKRYRD